MAVTLRSLRWAVQHLSFALLIYGGRFGVSLGPALPCFACPYVAGCGGYCYLMGLQGYIGFGMTLAAVGGPRLLAALGWLAVFIMLVAFLGKACCGWICPFGLVQDWLTALRNKLGIRERRLSPGAKSALAPLKYALLVYLALVPPLVTIGLLPEDFSLPFCNICPGKSLLPLFVGEARYLGLDMNNFVTFAFSLTLLIITGLMLVGMFFKARFFCLFCPLLALIHLLKPLTVLRLVKAPELCLGCGNCRRACPMAIEEVYQEKISPDVQTGECLNCGACLEACPTDSALKLKFLKYGFSSSRPGFGGLEKKP
ncbi:MAG: 4Fe-4S binding protein [Candidatus Adiutrix sp.]|jgi:polyferredoxin|nr:4Fe-4S binding protein [Candidatus Adiutrix sp.]